MQMRAKPRVVRQSGEKIVVDFDAIDGRQAQPFELGKFAQQQAHEAAERPAVAKIDAIAREIDASEHDLLLAARNERARLGEGFARRRRARLRRVRTE